LEGLALSVDHIFDYILGENIIPSYIRYLIAILTMTLPIWLVGCLIYLGELDEYHYSKSISRKNIRE
jgi:hypothetical protein